jgi:hypothetical protein
MQIKVYVIDVRVPRWARRAAIYGGVPAAVMLGASALVWADVTLPHTFTAGETLTAANLNASFEALRDAINDGNCPKGFTYDGTEPPYVVCTRTFNGATDDMVKVGDYWIDRYEASWCGGGTLGADSGSDTTVAACSEAGASTTSPNVDGALLRGMTWFRAAAVCANAGKHLCTNAQWQAAVSGTPDPGASDGTGGSCVTSAAGPRSPGAGTSCRSKWGAEDMIGNMVEWTADWRLAGRATTFADGQLATPWPTGYSPDNADNTSNLDGRTWWNSAWRNGLPSAGCRGGSWTSGTSAGAFALEMDAGLSHQDPGRGLRCCIGGS